ncbi:hypothetical protein BDR26DRAFT_868035 [Obelidium mucronatum]|nr:hypothetical protein BDR26DRAFT_868035 [Obelidium mucronatum]
MRWSLFQINNQSKNPCLLHILPNKLFVCFQVMFFTNSFSDSYRDERAAEQRLAAARKPDGVQLGRGLVRSGLVVTQGTGHVAKVVGVFTGGRNLELEGWAGKPCYVLEYERFSELGPYGVDDLHEEFVTPVGDLWIPVAQYLADGGAAALREAAASSPLSDSALREKLLSAKQAPNKVLVLGSLGYFSTADAPSIRELEKEKGQLAFTLHDMNPSKVQESINLLSKHSVVMAMHAHEFTSPFFRNKEWRRALDIWLRLPGRLLVFFGGEGPTLAEMFQSFGKPWKFCAYTRESHYIHEFWRSLIPEGCFFSQNLQKNVYNVKACLLSGVDPSDRLFSMGRGSSSYAFPAGKTAVAVGQVGQGRILFLGDVNWEESSREIALAIIKSVLENPSAAVGVSSAAAKFDDLKIRCFSPAELGLIPSASPASVFDYSKEYFLKSVSSGPHSYIGLHADGGCSLNGKQGARASFGVAGVINAPYSRKGLLPMKQAQTNQRAELFAAKQALELIAEELYDELDDPTETTFIIVMDSEYVVKGLCDWMRKWRQNGFKSAKGTPVVNGDLFAELDSKLLEFWNKKGLRVAFWHVLRAENKIADSLASAALRDAGF